jgi:hypothetical protein
MQAHRRLLPGLLLVALMLSLQVCGGSSPSGPTDSVTPTPVPTSTPSAGPTPEPPLSETCAKLGVGVPDSQAQCQDEAPDFRDQVLEAIGTVQNQHPEMFDGRQVLNAGGYIVELIRALDRQKLCGWYDGEEMGVKKNDTYNEQYDVLTARSQVRDAVYLGTCSPSVIPRAEPPLKKPPAGCPLPSSREMACGRPESHYYNDVEAAISKLLDEHPELFDPSDYAPGQGWPAYKDSQKYHYGVIDNLVAKGYCGIFDGEEIQIKKTNEFTEHFDINYEDHWVRRGPGIYRGSCYPAAF